ncbi:hypothetical protein HDK77DRAFT_164958 [Phyllosticta capitalensis]
MSCHRRWSRHRPVLIIPPSAVSCAPVVFPFTSTFNTFASDISFSLILLTLAATFQHHCCVRCCLLLPHFFLFFFFFKLCTWFDD